jgi:hypothetical protein
LFRSPLPQGEGITAAVLSFGGELPTNGKCINEHKRQTKDPLSLRERVRERVRERGSISTKQV